MNIKAVSFTLLFSQAVSVMPPAVAGGFLNPPVMLNENTSADTLGSIASGLGSAASGSGHFSDSVAEQAAGAASSLIEDQLAGWLRQFGTARVNLSVDRHGDWDTSSFDWLVPLWQSPQNILFTQLGFRNPNGRRTLNTGIGVRTFNNDWMFGSNVFIDNDFTGQNRRVGIGAEAWRDYLKLSINTYFGLTGWHQSQDFEDYDERPADGWDIRTQAWIPALPQLGGQLVYEKYHGNSVALVDKDTRRRNPSAVTAGLSYTPVPLVSLGIDHRMAAGSHDDTQLSVKFRYQFGTPWQTQVSPGAVSALRTLAGSRYDLVERNNAIVMDYRKQDLISLRLPKNLEGESGSDVSITAQVTSKYALDALDWSASSVTSAGGKVSAKGERDIRLTLPTWQAQGVNKYRISAVARDARGNRSDTASTVITVIEPSARLADGSMTVVRNNADADGIAINEVLTKVTDANGRPVSGQKVSFTATNGATVTAVTGITGIDGTTRARLTSLTGGESVVTASLANGQTAIATITFTDAARIAAGDFIVTQNNAVADGVAKNSVQARVTNASGQPLAGQAISFTATNDATVTVINGITGANGEATANLTSSTAGNSVVTAALKNGKTSDVSVTFSAIARIAAGDIMITKNNAAADGVAVNTVQVRVTDAAGKPLSGQAVIFVATNDANVTVVSGITGPDGIAIANLTSTTAGKSVVTAKLSNGVSASATTTFTALSGITVRDVTILRNNALADGSDTDIVRFRVTDGTGSALSGQHLSFVATNGAVLSASSAQTGADGTITLTLTSQRKGSSKVTATLANGTSATVTVNFTTATEIETGSFVVTANNALADGKATNAVQLKVVNGSGVAVSGQQVNFKATNGATVTTSTVTTGRDGLAGTTLTSTTAGDTKITATLNGTGETGTVMVTFVPSYADFAVVTANGQSFPITAGFPETGFAGARFTLTLPGSASADDYVWATSASWAFVSADTGTSTGTVRFSGTGTGSVVTVTAIPSSGKGQAYRYTMKVKKWFIFGSTEQSRAANTAYCKSAGYGVPLYSDMTNAPISRKNGTRAVGPLWSEWGSLDGYNIGIRSNYTYMASEYDSSVQYSVRLTTGWVYDIPSSVDTAAACMALL